MNIAIHMRNLIDTMIKSVAATPGLHAPITTNTHSLLLGENHPIVLHLKKFSSTQVSVTSQDTNDYILPNNNNPLVSLNQQSRVYHYTDDGGVYVYTHSTGRQYVGSSINFEDRTADHMHSFNGRTHQTKFHK